VTNAFSQRALPPSVGMKDDKLWQMAYHQKKIAQRPTPDCFGNESQKADLVKEESL
jgi:hypothetical protein